MDLPPSEMEDSRENCSIQSLREWFWWMRDNQRFPTDVLSRGGRGEEVGKGFAAPKQLEGRIFNSLFLSLSSLLIRVDRYGSRVKSRDFYRFSLFIREEESREEIWSVRRNNEARDKDCFYSGKSIVDIYWYINLGNVVTSFRSLGEKNLAKKRGIERLAVPLWDETNIRRRWKEREKKRTMETRSFPSNHVNGILMPRLLVFSKCVCVKTFIKEVQTKDPCRFRKLRNNDDSGGRWWKRGGGG